MSGIQGISGAASVRPPQHISIDQPIDPIQPVASVAPVPSSDLLTSQQDLSRERNPNSQSSAIPAPEDFQRSAANLNKQLESLNLGLQFEWDSVLERNVAKIVNTITGDVVKQIPSEELIRWQKEFTRLHGMLFDKKV